MAPKKTIKTVVKPKTAARRSPAKPKASPAVKPQVRISRVSVGLGSQRPNNAGVVNLKGVAAGNRPSVKIAAPAKYYGSEAYDDDLAKGEADFADELIDEPVESLGELLADDEQLSYEDEAAAATVKQKTAKSMPVRNDVSSGRVYKRLAVGFILLVLVIAAVVAYFALVKMTVTVNLKNEALAGDLPFTVYDQPEDFVLPDNSLKGLVQRIETAADNSAEVSGSEIIGEEVSGQITIYNKYIKNQPLVATTRLLSADGKLFRLKNSVNVPAGGQLQVEVYADQPQADMVVGAERFTIPGLWEGLRDKIYAESQAGAISFKQKVKRVVKQEDIDNAIKAGKDELLAAAKTQLTASYGNFNQQLFQLDEATVVSEPDAKVGEEKDRLTVKIKGAVLAVAFNSADALALAKTKAIESLASGKQLSGLSDDTTTYQLLSVNFAGKTAEVNAAFAGQVAVTSLPDLVDKRRLVNLNEDQLAAYLKGIPEIADFQVRFYPTFIRKAPALVDRIEVILAK